MYVCTDAPGGTNTLDDILRNYAESGNLTLYKPLLKAYFSQLNFKYVPR